MTENCAPILEVDQEDLRNTIETRVRLPCACVLFLAGLGATQKYCSVLLSTADLHVHLLALDTAYRQVSRRVSRSRGASTGAIAPPAAVC